MLKDAIYNELTIGEIVVADFRTAEIFKKAGIDFCCGGKKSLEHACMEKKINKTFLLNQLSELQNLPEEKNQNYNDWELSSLIDHIVGTHHQYVLKTLPELVFYTNKIARVHGENHPELIEVAELFRTINAELLQHLQKEEEVLFPAVKEAISNKSPGLRELIHSEIDRMNDEHELAGGAMDKINTLTLQYRIPQDACNTYNVSLKLLHQFEDDLHIHVHLENNILYPKALLL